MFSNGEKCTLLPPIEGKSGIFTNKNRWDVEKRFLSIDENRRKFMLWVPGVILVQVTNCEEHKTSLSWSVTQCADR